MDVNVEIKTRAKDVFAQHAILAGLLDGFLDTVQGELILAADVDIAFVRADRVGSNQHRFDDAEGIAFHDDPILEGSGFAFIGVTNDIFLGSWRLLDCIPLDTNGKTCATTTT